ncbi:GMP synthase [bacterium]|nr:MAG: GMP synthase [bacterium]
MEKKHIKVAIIDMNDNVPNQGMRCIKQILSDGIQDDSVKFDYKVFELRYKNEIPDLSFDVYISTGGPGSPLAGAGEEWEIKFKNWLDSVFAWNNKEESKKSVLMICYSFQLMAHLYKIADVQMRKSSSFGITPIHKTEDGKRDSLYEGLSDPFYAADFRDWQVIQPKREIMEKYGFKILSLEKIRPHVPLERAITGIRLNNEMVGVQFHPEADSEGMYFHFSKPEQKESIIKKHGQAKYEQILERLKKEDYIEKTYRTVIPNFLREGISKIISEESILS